MLVQLDECKSPSAKSTIDSNTLEPSKIWRHTHEASGGLYERKGDVDRVGGH